MSCWSRDRLMCVSVCCYTPSCTCTSSFSFLSPSRSKITPSSASATSLCFVIVQCIVIRPARFNGMLQYYYCAAFLFCMTKSAVLNSDTIILMMMFSLSVFLVVLFSVFRPHLLAVYTIFVLRTLIYE